MGLETALIWLGMFACLVQSATFSGLTLAYFSVSRLRIEAEAEAGNASAIKILGIRKDSNRMLATLLWGNVSVNTLLAQLSDSVLAGVAAFFFATVGITMFGEILPQAYFSRHAMRMGSVLAPVMRFYQFLLFPIAWPTSKLLDLLLGKEDVSYFDERTIRIILSKHVKAKESDISHTEGAGAINFLALDDIHVDREGEDLHPDSVIPLPVEHGLPALPDFAANPADPFLVTLHRSRKKWVVLTSPEGEPLLVMDSDAFLRELLMGKENFNPLDYCLRPIVITDPETRLGSVLKRLHVVSEHPEDDVIDHDVILYWSADKKKIITGADLLGRLLRGIVAQRVRRTRLTRGRSLPVPAPRIHAED